MKPVELHSQWKETLPITKSNSDEREVHDLTTGGGLRASDDVSGSDCRKTLVVSLGEPKISLSAA